MLAYLIRHAESLSNVMQAGGLNDGLTELGRRQAEAVALRLAAARPCAIYSSPYQRSIVTAAPLARLLCMQVRIRPELCEHHHLPAVMRAETLLAAMDELAATSSDVMPCPDFHGAYEWAALDEALEDLVRRMQAFARFLKQRWTASDDVVAVFGHGSPIARLIEAWLTDAPGPSFRFVIDNATITALRFCEGVSSLVCMNEASHLAKLPAPDAANYCPNGTVKPRSASEAW